MQAPNNDIANCSLFFFNVYKAVAGKSYPLETWGDL